MVSAKSFPDRSRLLSCQPTQYRAGVLLHQTSVCAASSKPWIIRSTRVTSQSLEAGCNPCTKQVMMWYVDGVYGSYNTHKMKITFGWGLHCGYRTLSNTCCRNKRKICKKCNQSLV